MKIMKKSFYEISMHKTNHFEGFVEAKLNKNLLREWKKFARFIFLVKNEVRYATFFVAPKQNRTKCFILSWSCVTVSLPSSFYANVLHHVLQLSTHIIELYFISHVSVFFITIAPLSFVRWIMDGYKINGRLYSSRSSIQTFYCVTPHTLFYDSFLLSRSVKLDKSFYRI